MPHRDEWVLANSTAGGIPFLCNEDEAHLVTLAASENPLRAGGLFNILAPDGRATYIFGMTGAIPVFVEGRWWTLLSAGWLHGGLLHILFNML